MARAGLHAAVHRMLTANAISAARAPAPGTDGVIGRAQFHYDCLGDAEAVALLARMNLTLFRLRQALLAGDAADYEAQREALAGLADDWLYQAPLFQVAGLMPAEGIA